MAKMTRRAALALLGAGAGGLLGLGYVLRSVSNTPVTHADPGFGGWQAHWTPLLITCKGEKMSTAAMATYGYDQIDQARAELNAVSK